MKHDMDMTEGRLGLKMLQFAVPVALTSLLQLFYSACDSVVVGRFAGKEALAAVGSTVSMINLLICLFSGLSVGVSVVCGRAIGSRDSDRVRKIVHTAAALGIICGLAACLLGQLLCRRALLLMGSPVDVIDLSTLYLRIYFLGVPFQLSYNYLAALLMARGDTRRPLLILCLAGILNIGLNLLLVIVFHLSVAGVAIATAVSFLFSLLAVLRILCRSENEFRLKLRSIRLDRGIAGDILRVGLPIGLQSGMFALANTCIQSAVNSFGSATMAADSASFTVEHALYYTCHGFGQAIVAFSSTNCGAARPENVKRCARYGLLYAAGSALVLGNLVYLFGQPVMSLFTRDPEVMELGTVRFLICETPYVMFGILESFQAVLQGTGHSLQSMTVSMVGICSVRLAWVRFVFPYRPSLRMLYMAFPVSWLITLIIMGLLCHRAFRTLPGTERSAGAGIAQG